MPLLTVSVLAKRLIQRISVHNFENLSCKNFPKLKLNVIVYSVLFPGHLLSSALSGGLFSSSHIYPNELLGPPLDLSTRKSHFIKT